jgi:spectinomycin phosphotransferase
MWVSADFGVEVDRFVPVVGGADENAELWRATGPGGSAYAVKWSGGGSPGGLALTAHLAARGTPGIPAPRLAGDGRPWSVRGGRRLSVVPWIDDPVAWRGTMTRAHWAAYGRVLAALHATPVPPEIAGMLPREDHAHGRFVEAARAITGRIAGTAASPWWPRDAVEGLIARADRIGPVTRGGAAVLCHGDPHLLNVLSGGDDRVWLIDWDDAVLAPREWDLMFVIGGVLARVGAEQRAWFFEGYGPVEVDADRLAYYRCVRALDDAASWAGAALDAVSPEAEANALEILRDTFGPAGQGTLALT